MVSDVFHDVFIQVPTRREKIECRTSPQHTCGHAPKALWFTPLISSIGGTSKGWGSEVSKVTWST